MLEEGLKAGAGSSSVDPVLVAVLANARRQVRRRRALAARQQIAAAALVVCLLIGAGLIAVRGIASAPRPSSTDIASQAAEPPAVEPQRLLPIAAPDARALNARLPILRGELASAPPFHFAGTSDARERATDCLAAAAWYEAGDNATGEQAVVQVVLNRVRHPAFPATVCGVVFQGSERSTGCQFTFTCDGSMARIPSASAWDRARAIATSALDGKVDAQVGQATHYHADWVVPYWRDSLDKIAQVGPHIFYRWKGYWGSASAFRTAGQLQEPIEASLGILSSAHRLATAGSTAGSEGQGPAPPAAQSVPLPTPIMIPGVSQRSTRGTLVRGEGSNLFFIQIDPAAFPGTYAIAALALCKGRSACTVFAWRDPQAMAVAAPLTEAQSHALSFYYHRDEKGEQALWNCSQVDRPSENQCLPAERAALAGLGTATVPFPNS